MTSTVTLTGNLTKDPDLRFTTSGQPTASFSLAVNRRWQNRQTNEWEEATSYFDVVTWAALAENVATCLTKGARVTVHGRLDQRSWEGNDGEKRTKIEVTATEVAASLRYATVEITKAAGRQPVPAGPDEEPF